MINSDPSSSCSGTTLSSPPPSSSSYSSKFTSTVTKTTVSLLSPGERAMEHGVALALYPVYPVSSFNSLSAACSAVSPLSIKPAGSSIVSRSIGGRNCLTNSVCVSRLDDFSFANTHTASATAFGSFVVLVAASHVRSSPVGSIYVIEENLNHLVSINVFHSTTFDFDEHIFKEEEEFIIFSCSSTSFTCTILTLLCFLPFSVFFSLLLTDA